MADELANKAQSSSLSSQSNRYAEIPSFPNTKMFFYSSYLGENKITHLVECNQKMYKISPKLILKTIIKIDEAIPTWDLVMQPIVIIL